MTIGRNFVWMALLWCAALSPAVGGDGPSLYVLQVNAPDPTAPSSQPGGRWYHWLGVDPAVTHLETGFAIDADRFAGRGQRIEVRTKAPVTAVQVKVKRIGQPGALRWEAGTAWGRHDLGKGEIPAARVHVTYEHFVTLSMQRPASADTIYLQFKAASGRCPDDYYAIYCTWAETHPEKVRVNGYDGPHDVGMMYRTLRADPDGAALERSGHPTNEGASMMTRLLTTEPGPGRRELLAGEEDPYSFVEALAAGRDPRWVGLPWPGARAEAGEIELTRDWRIQVAAAKSPQVVTAVRDLEEFLRVRLKAPVKVSWNRSAQPQPRTIMLAEGADLPDGPRRPAGYRYEARRDAVTIHGFDARGVLRGVWFIEDLLMLRGGPFLKPDARTREPRYSPRITCSAWGGTGELAASPPVYTDAHLALISHYGYDAIWLNWYSGSDDRKMPPTRIEPGRIPEGTSYRPFTARLRDLTERAERYDLDVVILYAAPHPQNADEQRQLQAEARQLLRDVPKIKTIVMLDEGMGSVKKGMKAWVDTCDLLAKAFYEERPELRLAAWIYTFRSRTPEPAAWQRRTEEFCRLDRRVGYIGNFDGWWARRRDGTLQNVFDYCLSLRAPSDDFRFDADFLVAEAKRDGQPMRPIWPKIESRFSQESNIQPEIPSMQRWVKRYQAVNDFQPAVSGVFANWYHQGFFPTPVTELFGWLSYTEPPDTDGWLRALARREFGPDQEDLVLGAWRDFSEAIWHYPFYFGLSYTMNAGVSQPFWLDPKAANPRPWRRGFVNNARTLNLANTGEGPGSGPENRARLRTLQEHWHAGLAKLAKALAAAPPQVHERAQTSWRNARSFGCAVDTTLRLAQWFDARDRLTQAKIPADALAALDELERIGREELAAARAALPLYAGDSRLGFLNHGRGCFTADTIRWKIALLEKTLAEELPARRAEVKP